MIINRILDDFHPLCMYGIDQFMIGFFSADPWVYFVMIGKCVSMFGAIGHIIFNNRIQPNGCNSHRLQVIKMILNSFQIAAMTLKNRIAVKALISHSRDSVIGGIAITEAIGHNQIHQIF